MFVQWEETSLEKTHAEHGNSMKTPDLNPEPEMQRCDVILYIYTHTHTEFQARSLMARDDNLTSSSCP